MNFDFATLEQQTGGIFDAITSSERTTRVRAWLETHPPVELMQAVYKELSARDKGASRPLRDRLQEVRKEKTQEIIMQEWADKAQALLDLPRINIADAMAWQRDAAEASAPLSKEPLATLRQRLAERVSKAEALQHFVGVQREAAALFAQRLEILSTKPLVEVLAQREALLRDAQAWQTKSQELPQLPEWQDIDAKLPPQLNNAQSQFIAIWGAFSAALETASLALADHDAPLPSIPVWADEIRQQRGLAQSSSGKAAPAEKSKVDPEKRQAAHDSIAPILKKLEDELEAGHGKASVGAANSLRQALKEQGAWIDSKLDLACHAALSAAGELEGWQRWHADQLRQKLLKQAEELVANPLSGRKQQEAIRSMRDEWKLADQGGVPNHGLWRRFDEACNTAYQVVESWLQEIKAKSAVVIAQRTALIEKLKSWGIEQAGKTDWKELSRNLHQFSQQWREAGHLGERDFEPLQSAWKAAFKEIAAPLEAAQKSSVERRQLLIERAKALVQSVAEGADLRIDLVRELQQQWQAEAQSVLLERKAEQKYWDEFKGTLDQAFAKKDELRQAARTAHLASLSAHDKAVLEASKALEEATASGHVTAIQTTMQALQAALRGQAPAAPVPSEAPAPTPVPPTPAPTSDAPQTSQASSEAESTPQPQADSTTPMAETSELSAAPEAAAPAADAPAPEAKVAPTPAPKPVIAVRGDDRTPSKAPETAQFGKKGTFAAQSGRGFPAREARKPDPQRLPRLSDEAFHVQRRAMEQAEIALKKLQMQAHGEALTHLLSAWETRDVDTLPSVSSLGKAVNSALRSQWLQALRQTAASVEAASTALLRLELASGAPTPAEFLGDRRAFQLQLLTQRNAPSPQQTWGLDVATVLGASYDAVSAKRLQAALKTLLK